MIYQIAQDFCLPSRHGNRRIASYVTVSVTRKAGKKTSKMVFHLTEIALARPVSGLNRFRRPADLQGLNKCPDRPIFLLNRQLNAVIFSFYGSLYGT